jgi:peroxiredoxin Q/BCP
LVAAKALPHIAPEVITMLFAKGFLIATGLLAAAAVATLSTACMSTAPSGEGSKDADGNTRDPSVMLNVGEPAPDFTTRDEQGNTVALASFRGKSNVVLIFYPANETPGCTAQLCAARDDWKLYQERNVAVLAVNPASPESHQAFKRNHNFPFPLLSDTEGNLIRAYGARGLMGVTTRTVYGINKDGVIVFAQRGIPSTQTILAAFEAPTGASEGTTTGG